MLLLPQESKSIENIQPQIFQTEEHWKSHMQRRHQEEFKKVEAQTLFQMMTNVILQQQATQQIQFLNKQKALSDQFILLEQNKKLVEEDWSNFDKLETALDKQLEILNSNFQLEADKLAKRFYENLQQMNETSKNQVKKNQESIGKAIDHMQMRLTDQDYKIEELKKTNTIAHHLTPENYSKHLSSFPNEDSPSKQMERVQNQKQHHKSERMIELEQFEKNQEILEANQKLINIKDFELQIQKFHTLALTIQMNRNLGKTPEYTNYEKAKVIIQIGNKIDRCLLELIGKSAVQLEDEETTLLDQQLHFLKEKNIHYEKNKRKEQPLIEEELEVSNDTKKNSRKHIFNFKEATPRQQYEKQVEEDEQQESESSEVNERQLKQENLQQSTQLDKYDKVNKRTRFFDQQYISDDENEEEERDEIYSQDSLVKNIKNQKYIASELMKIN